MILLLISGAVIYFALKVVLWQLKGLRVIVIDNGELKLSKRSPLWKKTRTYRLADVKNVDVIVETASIGPLAMLQLLRITDGIKITFSYGYETITATSGMDQTEAMELKNILMKRIGQ
jgi:hypothetical protein